MLRCAITDRSLFCGDEHEKRAVLIRRTAYWAAQCVDLIQLREKDLVYGDPEALASLARSILAVIPPSSPTRLLINSSLTAATQSRAHGLHLPAHSPLLPDDVRRRYLTLGLPNPIVTVSCHTLAEVQIARRNRASAILFAPVFGKIVTENGLTREVTPAQGLEALHAAVEAAGEIPVYALGGVTLENAPQCLAAGARGIAGIRLFHAAH